jgi:hypothetical protein
LALAVIVDCPSVRGGGPAVLMYGKATSTDTQTVNNHGKSQMVA